MKIGILTHPLDYNYGCLLQAFALQKTLKSMGHDVVTINRFTDTRKPFSKKMKDWLYRFAKRVIRGSRVPLTWNSTETMEVKNVLSSNTQKFVDRNIVNTGQLFPDSLPKIDKEYKFDAYVVGSDQVWLPHFSLNAFLDFVERDNVKRIFYAASSGKRSFADYPEIAAKCRALADKFSAISVREDSLIPIVRDVLKQDAVQVLDPTLLLDAQDYVDACVEKYPDTPVIFTYILDKTADKQSVVDRTQHDLKLPVVKGSVDKDYVVGDRLDPQKHTYPSVDHWIMNLKRAKFVVTDSFHGTCMSIVFRKPFVVIGNQKRGLNRFLSVLKMFNLQERLITDSSSFSEGFYKDLNNQEISDVLNGKRKESLRFLIENLK